MVKASDLRRSDRQRVLEEFGAELARAEAKFPGQHLRLGFSAGRWRSEADAARVITDLASEQGELTWADVLREEFYEALGEDDTGKARAELVQLAAMCLRAILDIDDPQPAAFSAPSGRQWRQAGVDGHGRPVMTLVPYSQAVR